jgi:hypothetical protein
MPLIVYLVLVNIFMKILVLLNALADISVTLSLFVKIVIQVPMHLFVPPR